MGCPHCWTCQALLAVLFAAAPLAQTLPLASTALSVPPTGATNATEVDALIIFTNALLPTEAQQAAYGWQLNQDPCGYATCSPRLPPTCNWKGLSCINWHVTGIALDPSAQANSSAGISRILSPYIVYLQQLQTLQLPGQRYTAYRLQSRTQHCTALHCTAGLLSAKAMFHCKICKALRIAASMS